MFRPPMVIFASVALLAATAMPVHAGQSHMEISDSNRSLESSAESRSHASQASPVSIAGLMAPKDTYGIPVPVEVVDPADPWWRRLNVSVGLGTAFIPDYEGSNDYEFVPLWFLQVGNLYHPQTHVRILGTRLESNLMPHEHFRLGIVGTYLADYDDVDDRAVKRLTRPDDALQLGLVVGYDFSTTPRERYVLEIEATYDALNGNGGLVTPRGRVQLPLTDRFTLGGAASFSWASKDYMSNRFGISAADAARSGLANFDAGSGIKDFSLDMSLTYAFDTRWSVIAIGGYQRMLSDAADSPIVDDRGSRNQFSVGALISYRL